MTQQRLTSFIHAATKMLEKDREIYVWKNLSGEEDSWAVSNNPEDHADIPAYMYANAEAAIQGLTRNYQLISHR